MTKLNKVLRGGLQASVLMAAGITWGGQPPADSFRGTHEELAAGQRAIEEVRWQHRIWPADNPQPKPSLASLMSDDAFRSRADDALRRSHALEILFRQSISRDDLQAEIDRMARASKDPAFLAETWRALGNDAARIGEAQARPAIASRRLRELYASDASLHSEVRNAAVAAMRRVRSIADLRIIGSYSERTYRRGDAMTTDGSVVVGDPEWKRLQRELRYAFNVVSPDDRPIPTGNVSRIIETETDFHAVTVLAQSDDFIRVASVRWVKTPFDVWWSGKSATIDATPYAPDASLVLPPLSPSCTPDTWSLMDPDMPTPRSAHAAIWTGSEMIVWGGQEGMVLQEGWRYDPSADTWTRISDANAPEPRSDHLAFWTGSEMLVVGGQSTYTTMRYGGRYSPTTNTWSAVSDVNAPPSFLEAAGVWTGSRLIVWGGQDANGTPVSDGGVYDPSTDAWTPTTQTGVPLPRRGHTAVWSGSKMVVWGGTYCTNVPSYSCTDQRTGGVYDPVADSWSSTKTAGAPTARGGHSAVWDGSRMIVWGGSSTDSSTGITTYFGDGMKYNPVNDTWGSMSAMSAPSARDLHRAVWTGTQMIVWGGSDDLGPSIGGGRYSSSTNSWQAVSTTAAPSARYFFSAVWTGSRMVVWGGNDGFGSLDSGGRYDPVTNSWTATRRTSSRPAARDGHSAVWTGAEMLVFGGHWGLSLSSPYDGYRYDLSTDAWQPTATTALWTETTGNAFLWTGSQVLLWGGQQPDPGPPSSYVCVGTGLRYDPTLDAWSSISTTGAPAGRCNHTAVWTGDRMVVWGGVPYGGATEFNDGGRYDPVSQTWTPTSTTDAPSPRYSHSAIWTGRRMVVWGGAGFHGSVSDVGSTGGQYDPNSDTWTPTSLVGAPSARTNHHAAWSGRDMVLRGGTAGFDDFDDGGRYDPDLDAWRATSTTNAPPALTYNDSTFVCGKLVEWGLVSSPSAPPHYTGALYDPLQDSWSPIATDAHVYLHYYFPMVSTDHQVIVWAGDSNFNDTNTGAVYCACSTAPQPASSRIFVEKNSGIPRVTWEIDPAALGYDVLRGSLASLRSSHGNFGTSTTDCLADNHELPWQDDADPAPAGGSWYLIRSVAASSAGTYDDGSARQVAPRDAAIASSPAACP